jgi:hypothetical protein
MFAIPESRRDLTANVWIKFRNGGELTEGKELI